MTEYACIWRVSYSMTPAATHGWQLVVPNYSITEFLLETDLSIHVDPMPISTFAVPHLTAADARNRKQRSWLRLLGKGRQDFQETISPKCHGCIQLSHQALGHISCWPVVR